MKFRARVEVTLKPGYSDPEGETTRQSLLELGFSVAAVGVSKVYEVTLEAGGRDEAKRLVDGMCRRLLANPVKDNYVLEIEET